MSENDQADGFFEDERYWGKCSHLVCIPYPECLYALGPNENSGRGRNVSNPEPDVYQQTHGHAHFRLAKGFNLLRGSER